MIPLILAAQPASACGVPVCLVDPETLSLPRIITFDDAQASRGPGHLVAQLLVMNGAVFGERFAGQSVIARGDHDDIAGQARAPLTIMPGADGQNLSIVYFDGNNILNGYGVSGYPRRNAQGEGAISFLFDENQSALSFQIRGGEQGAAEVRFLTRDGNVIATLSLSATGEHAFGFIRADGTSDIAGVTVTNADPQGIALDNLRFGKSPDLS
ncbi:MAG: hypothetical protein PVI41_02500 [Roseobacter sp.]|jgi:hypothetical protein